MKTIQFDFDNVGGITQVYAIPLASFLRLRKDYINEMQYFEVKQRADIIAIPVYADSSFTFNETQRQEDGGNLWAVEIAGLIPKRYRLNEKSVRTLERGEWLVLFQDNNGDVVLAGTIEVPLRFLSARTTGTETEVNGNRFTFTGMEAEPSVIVDNKDITRL
jgi:hypothetical protein